MRLIHLYIALFFISGCATAPMSYEKIEEGNWRAKALVKDHDQGRSYIVNLNLNAIRSKNLRMDVTTALGTAVAMLTADEKEVHYLLVEPKKYYYGTARPEVMRPILSIPFDPRWIHNLLFDISFGEKSREKNWACTSDNRGFVSQCVDSLSGVKITWSQRAGARKTVRIEHKRASVQLNIHSFQSKVEERKDLFDLKAPSHFEKLNLR